MEDNKMYEELMTAKFVFEDDELFIEVTNPRYPCETITLKGKDAHRVLNALLFEMDYDV